MIYKEEFVPWLESELGKAYYNGSKTEIITFCPWCEGSSPTGKKHGHLYIGVSEPVFYCQKCGEKGIVAKLISYLKGNFSQFVNEDVLQRTLQYSYTQKNLESLGECKFKTTSNSENFKNNQLKKEYLYKRFGKEFNLEKIPRLVISIKDFLRDNNLQINDWRKTYIDQLDESFVGFLSNKGTTIVFRNCADNNLMRYFKFPLVQNNFFFLDFYGLKTGNLTDQVPNIILCEGVFDMLVPLINSETESLRKNSFFWASALGKGSYLKTFFSVLNYCKLVKANVYILSDSDVPWYFYYSLRDTPYVDKMYIYYNRYKKDFGELPIDIVSRELKPKNRRKIYYAKSSNT